MKTVFLASAISYSSLFAISEPYNSIKSVSYEPYFFENSWILLGKLNSLGTTVFLDVESDGGKAARYIAANTSESVKVYNINSWSVNEHQFQQFLSDVVNESMTERITPIRMGSNEAASTLNLSSELIYLDCEDEATVSEKISSWVTHPSPNGVIAGNRWEWPSVELSVVQAANELNLSISVINNFWFLQKS